MRGFEGSLEATLLARVLHLQVKIAVERLEKPLRAPRVVTPFVSVPVSVAGAVGVVVRGRPKRLRLLEGTVVLEHGYLRCHPRRRRPRVVIGDLQPPHRLVVGK